MATSETDIGVSGVYPPTPFGIASSSAPYHRGFAPAEVGLFSQQGLSDTRYDVAQDVNENVRQTSDIESLRHEIRRAADVSVARAAAQAPCPGPVPLRAASTDAEVARLRSELQVAQQRLFQADLAKTIADAIREGLSNG